MEQHIEQAGLLSCAAGLVVNVTISPPLACISSKDGRFQHLLIVLTFKFFQAGPAVAISPVAKCLPCPLLQMWCCSWQPLQKLLYSLNYWNCNDGSRLKLCCDERCSGQHPAQRDVRKHELRSIACVLSTNHFCMAFHAHCKMRAVMRAVSNAVNRHTTTAHPFSRHEAPLHL